MTVSWNVLRFLSSIDNPTLLYVYVLLSLNTCYCRSHIWKGERSLNNTVCSCSRCRPPPPGLSVVLLLGDGIRVQYLIGYNFIFAVISKISRYFKDLGRFRSFPGSFEVNHCHRFHRMVNLQSILMVIKTTVVQNLSGKLLFFWLIWW